MSARLGSVRRAVARSRAAMVVLVVAVLTLGSATTASAFWTVAVVNGSGAHALATASSLTPPTAAAAVQSSTTSVQVSWTPPASQLAGARYTVTRTSGVGAGTVVCAAVSTTSCTDTGLATGSTYGWSVVAVIGQNWRSSVATAGATLLGVATTLLASGNVGSAYSQTLSAVGGTGSYSWALTAGTLPTGLTLAGTGVISGTPTVGGTTTGLQFTVTDGVGRSATSAALTLTILKRSQTITATGAPTSQAAGTTWTPAVTASSGLPATITIDPTTSANCAVSAGIVTFLALTTCRVNFDQPGNASFEAAPRVQQAITVFRGPQTITFVAPIDAAVGGTVALGATASSGLPVTLVSSTTSICTVSGGNVTYLAAGTCTITASQSGNVNFFAAASVSQTFTVSVPAGLGVSIVGGTGTPVLSCTGTTVTATRACTISGVGLSGSATLSVVVLSSAGNRVVFSYVNPGTATQTGQDTGTATIPSGTSITATTLTASHVGNAPKTSTITFGTYTLTVTVVT